MGLISSLNRTRKIGAEYECAVPIIGAGGGHDVQETIASILSRNGINACARNYSHAPVPNNCDIVVESDSSIVGEARFHGVQWAQVEVKSRILNGIDDWERVVPPTLEILRYAGARVNHSTGHHLHLAFPEITQDVRKVRSIWNLFHRFDSVIFGLTAPSRRNNSYCRPMPSGTKFLHGANSIRELKRRLRNFDRYQGLNLTQLFEDAPRIEIRHHHGTLDAGKARTWLRLQLAMVEHAVTRSCQAAPAPLPNDRKGIEALLITVGLKINTRVYSAIDPELRETGRQVLKTWKKFNGPPRLTRKKPTEADSDDRDAAVREEAECAE